MTISIFTALSVQDPVWEEIPDLDNLVERAVQAAIHAVIEGGALPPPAINKALEVSVVLANDDLVQLLNREYRDKDKPTNILSFAALDDSEGIIMDANAPLELGDLILSFHTITKESEEQDKPVIDHITHLIVHGTLHLLGYDHQEEAAAQNMEALEIKILAGLEIENPYTDPLV